MKIKVVKFNSLDSTNNKAIEMIKKNQTKPTLLVSKNQLKGKGTMGKKWISQKGNLFISIYFQIEPEKINFKQFANLNALLIKKILSMSLIKDIKIKWPNDLLIEKKKFCGILQETICHKNNFFLIIGIGVNTVKKPKITNFKTSCLKDFLKKDVDNDKILRDIKNEYEKFIIDIKRKNFLTIKKNLR